VAAPTCRSYTPVHANVHRDRFARRAIRSEAGPNEARMVAVVLFFENYLGYATESLLLIEMPYPPS